MKRRPQLALPTGLIIDNFAGGGGASTGIELALGRSPDLAVNHDPEAVAMHEANHPATRHLCGDVWYVDPVRVCSGRPVALAWFSPDCKHHSKAKGGKPRDAKIRGLAWVVVRWARAVQPAVIMLENVEEFADWARSVTTGRRTRTGRAGRSGAGSARLRLRATWSSRASCGRATTERRRHASDSS